MGSSHSPHPPPSLDGRTHPVRAPPPSLFCSLDGHIPCRRRRLHLLLPGGHREPRRGSRLHLLISFLQPFIPPLPPLPLAVGVNVVPPLFHRHMLKERVL
jgi:hypothetical protein